MRERMDGIWRKIEKKQALQEAAHRLQKERKGFVGLKLSLSAALGLAVILLPIVGAAQDFARIAMM